MSPSLTHADGRLLVGLGRCPALGRARRSPRSRPTSAVRRRAAGGQSLGTHTSRVSSTRTSVASSRIESVSTSAAAALPALVDLGDLVEDLLLELGEIVLRRAPPSPRRSACAPRRGRHAAPGGGAADRARDRARAPPAAEAARRGPHRRRRSARSPGASACPCRAPRRAAAPARARFSSRSRFASSRSRIFAASASARSCAAASQRAAKSSADSPGRETSLSAPVALQLERPAVDEVALDRPSRSSAKNARLAERRLREHVRGAGGAARAEVAVVEVDLRLAAEVEPAVERAVDRLELLLLVDVRGACRRSGARRAPRGTRAAACEPCVGADLRGPRRSGVEVRDGRCRPRPAGATDVSSAASSTAGVGAAVAGSTGVSAAGAGSVRRRCPASVATCSFVSGPRRYDIAHRVANSRGSRRLRRDEQELALLRARRSPRRARPTSVPPAAERSPSSTRALSFSVCSRPDEPCARVRHRLVVEVDGVLRREHEPEPERAALLEDRQDRLLRGRRGGRRHVAEDLVHVRERAQVGRPRLAAHPGDELREDERDDELPLLLGEVREVDDRAARLALGA